MLPGQILGGRYQLRERIGTGGMGEVWRAEDTMLERNVAVKVLHPGMAHNFEVRQRFLREARAVAALNAPNVVAMYDTAEETDANGSVVPYLVMEYLTGHPLSHFIDTRQIPSPPEIVRLIAQVARGLDAAHKVGIIHRDVKATNIMVSPSGTPTILDFGIARRRGESGITTTGAVMGTTEYASPEQLRDEELTPASDIYALGVVAYECLAGGRPFDGESVASIIAGHLNRPPPALPANVPQPICDVVMRALAKDPKDRFANAADFADACQSTQTTSAPLPKRDRAAPAPPPIAELPTALSRRPANRNSSHVPAPLIGERPSILTKRHNEPETEPPIVAGAQTGAPKRRRGRVVALISGLVIVVMLAAGGVMFFTDNLPGSSDTDEPTDDVADSPSDKPGPKPVRSVMVSKETGRCLLIAKVDGSEEAVNPHMGLCQNTKFEKYTFDAVDGDAVTIEYTDVYAEREIRACLGTSSADEGLISDSDCKAELAWTFTHLSTKDKVDYWQIHSAADGEVCLQAGDADRENAKARPCNGSDIQVWRTDAAE